MQKIVIVILVSCTVSMPGFADYWINFSSISNVADCAGEGQYLWCATGSGIIKVDTENLTHCLFASAEGLPIDNATSIAVDKNSVVWCGTWNKGLFSFDGNSWRHFTSENSGLPSNDITRIFIDSNNVKWFAQPGYITRYDDKKWSVIDPYIAGIMDNRVKTLYVTSDGEIWFGTETGGTANFDGSEWWVYTGDNGLYGNDVRDIAVDHNGVVWFVSGWGVKSFDGTIWKTHTKDIAFSNAERVYVDSANRKWFATRSGVTRFNGLQWESFLTSSANWFTSIAECDTGIWFGKSSGGTVYSIVGDEVVPYSIAGPFKYRQILDIKVDKNNEKWFAMQLSNPVNYDGFLWTIHDRDGAGNYLFGEYYSVAVGPDNSKWYASGGRILHHSGEGWKVTKNRDAFTSDTVVGLACDHDGALWIGTWNNGVYCYADGEFIHFPGGDTGLANGMVQSLAVDSRNHLWVGTQTGISRYDGEKWTNYRGGFTVSIAEDLDGNMWFGTYDGLKRFDGNRWSTFTPDNCLLTERRINAVAVDADNTLWLGTMNGLLQFDGETCTSFTMANSGLTNDTVYSLSFDLDGVLWIGTDNGVSSYYPDIGTVVESKQAVPAPIIIHGVFPNPFNPSTTIDYSIPEPSIVKLTVYSVSGQKIATLVDDFMPAGKHIVQFDGSNHASGLYFYRLETEGMVKAGKMMLVK